MSFLLCDAWAVPTGGEAQCGPAGVRPGSLHGSGVPCLVAGKNRGKPPTPHMRWPSPPLPAWSPPRLKSPGSRRQGWHPGREQALEILGSNTQRKPGTCKAKELTLKPMKNHLGSAVPLWQVGLFLKTESHII